MNRLNQNQSFKIILLNVEINLNCFKFPEVTSHLLLPVFYFLAFRLQNVTGVARLLSCMHHFLCWRTDSGINCACPQGSGLASVRVIDMSQTIRNISNMLCSAMQMWRGLGLLPWITEAILGRKKNPKCKIEAIETYSMHISLDGCWCWISIKFWVFMDVYSKVHAVLHSQS